MITIFHLYIFIIAYELSSVLEKSIPIYLFLRVVSKNIIQNINYLFRKQGFLKVNGM